jgi:hypothetical protein
VTTQPDTDAPPPDMCPNCVTPWKCNGPHLSDSPQEGRPTTPQTEAGRRLLSGPAMRRALLSDILAIEREAAAGALPSVERLAEALATVWPEEHGMEGIVNATHRLQARQIADALAAAPPEASER